MQSIRSELKACWANQSSRVALLLVSGVTIVYGGAMILLGVLR